MTIDRILIVKIVLALTFGILVSALIRLTTPETSNIALEAQAQAQYEEIYNEVRGPDGSISAEDMDRLIAAANTYNDEFAKEFYSNENQGRINLNFQIQSLVILASTVICILAGYFVSKFRLEEALLIIGLVGTSTILSGLSLLPILLGLTLAASSAIFRLVYVYNKL